MRKLRTRHSRFPNGYTRDNKGSFLKDQLGRTAANIHKGIAIKWIRASLDVTQGEVAQEMGLCRSSIYQRERGFVDLTNAMVKQHNDTAYAISKKRLALLEARARR